MEQKLPAITNKVWRFVRIIFKRKLLVDLNIILKRVKVARKPLHNHQHHLGEYEFSCSSTPRHPLSLFSTRNKHKNNSPCQRLPNPKQTTLGLDDCDDLTVDPAFIKVLNDMLTTNSVVFPESSGFMKSPVVESWFPVVDGLDDGEVDEAAEKFITRFYNDLRRENI